MLGLEPMSHRKPHQATHHFSLQIQTLQSHMRVALHTLALDFEEIQAAHDEFVSRTELWLIIRGQVLPKRRRGCCQPLDCELPGLGSFP